MKKEYLDTIEEYLKNSGLLKGFIEDCMEDAKFAYKTDNEYRCKMRLDTIVQNLRADGENGAADIVQWDINKMF